MAKATTTKATSKAKETEKPALKVGLQAFGIIRVFQKTKKVKVKGKNVEITDFWTNVSRKDENGEYINKSIGVFFGKDAEKPEENGLIDVTEAWFFITGNEGYERISLFISEWEAVEEEF